MSNRTDLNFYVTVPVYYKYVNYIWTDDTYLDKLLKQNYNIGFIGLKLMKIKDQDVGKYPVEKVFKKIQPVLISKKHVINEYDRYDYIISGGYQPFLLTLIVHHYIHNQKIKLVNQIMNYFQIYSYEYL